MRCESAHLREPAVRGLRGLECRRSDLCRAWARRTRAQVFWFSRQKEVERGAWVRDGNIVFRDALRAEGNYAGFGDPAERRAQPGKCSGSGLCRQLDGMCPGKDSAGRARLQGRRASAGIRGNHRAVSTTTTIPRLQTWMRPSRRWNRFRRISISFWEAKTRAAIIPC